MFVSSKNNTGLLKRRKTQTQGFCMYTHVLWAAHSAAHNQYNAAPASKSSTQPAAVLSVLCHPHQPTACTTTQPTTDISASLHGSWHRPIIPYQPQHIVCFCYRWAVCMYKACVGRASERADAETTSKGKERCSPLQTVKLACVRGCKHAPPPTASTRKPQTRVGHVRTYICRWACC